MRAVKWPKRKGTEKVKLAKRSSVDRETYAYLSSSSVYFERLWSLPRHEPTSSLPHIPSFSYCILAAVFSSLCRRGNPFSFLHSRMRRTRSRTGLGRAFRRIPWLTRMTQCRSIPTQGESLPAFFLPICPRITYTSSVYVQLLYIVGVFLSVLLIHVSSQT